jgi:hypothetical protein
MLVLYMTGDVIRRQGDLTDEAAECFEIHVHHNVDGIQVWVMK